MRRQLPFVTVTLCVCVCVCAAKASNHQIILNESDDWRTNDLIYIYYDWPQCSNEILHMLVCEYCVNTSAIFDIVQFTRMFFFFFTLNLLLTCSVDRDLWLIYARGIYLKYTGIIYHIHVNHCKYSFRNNNLCARCA